jgi:hypothetical protein
MNATTTANLSNDLRHTMHTISKDGDKLTINIRLNDECKNGHQDFSITGDIYEKGKPRTDKYYLMGGCIHEEILAVCPELKPFVDLHLSDADGAPMYALENGHHYMRESGKEVAMDYLRITEDEYNVLKGAADKLHFAFLLFQMNIPQRWQQEAKAAIKQLEEMTGKTFVNDSKKGNLPPLAPEQVQALQDKLQSGYYAPAAIAERQEQAQEAARLQKYAKIAEDRDKAIEKANNAYSVKKCVLDGGLPLDNFIYYDHMQQGCFNWSDISSKITEEQFKAFEQSVDYSLLPAKFHFKLGKGK